MKQGEAASGAQVPSLSLVCHPPGWGGGAAAARVIEGRGGGKEEVPGERPLFEGRDLRVARLLPLPSVGSRSRRSSPPAFPRARGRSSDVWGSEAKRSHSIFGCNYHALSRGPETQFFFVSNSEKRTGRSMLTDGHGHAPQGAVGRGGDCGPLDDTHVISVSGSPVRCVLSLPLH